MNAQTHAIGAGLRGDALVRSQIEALASGQVDTATFLRLTIARLRKDPDENWEVLSLLDQAFRLGKINEDVFKGVKNGLAEFVLRPRSHEHPTGARPSATVTPAPVSAPAAPSMSPAPAAAAPVMERIAPEPVFPETPLTFLGSQAVTQPTGTQARLPPTLREASRAKAAAAAPAAVDPPRSARPARVEPPAPTRAEPPPAPPAALHAEPRVAPAAPARGEERATAPEDRDIAPGDVLRGRYRIVNFIGQGGRGLVYEATDPYRLESQAFGQRIAIKVMRRQVAQRTDAVLELRREFQLLQSLSHPNIVRVHEFDRDGTLSFFTMELLNGVLLTRLAHAHQNRPMKRADALCILRDIGAAVSFAHSRSVVHGDLNPQNIFLTFDGEIRVLDFGAARKTSQFSLGGGDELHGSFATAGYASTQVMQGEQPQVDDDIFSMGCIAYLLLAGRHPFGGVSALEAQAARLKPRRPRGVKEATWRALKQALQYDRRKRPKELSEWLSRLELGQASAHLPSVNEMLEEPVHTSGGMPWGTLAAVLLIALAGGYYYLLQQEIVRPPAFVEALLKDDAASRDAQQPTAEAVDEPLPPLSTSPNRGAARAGTSGAKVPAPTPGAARDSAAKSASGNARTALAPVVSATRGLTETAANTATSPSAAGRSASLPANRPETTAVPPAAAAPVTAGSALVPAARAATARIELASDTVEVAPQESTARIVVHRRTGSNRGDATFSWWTESGTAKPGADFQAVTPRVEQIPDGAASVTLSVPLAQTLHAQSRSFYVVIDQSEGGATVSGRTLTMVTLSSAE